VSDETVVLLGEEAPVVELDELRPLITEGQERGLLTFQQIETCLEEIEITKHGRAVARLVAATGPHALRGRFANVAISAAADDELFTTGASWDLS